MKLRRSSVQNEIDRSRSKQEGCLACFGQSFQFHGRPKRVACEREAREVQKLNPSYEEGYLDLAYAQLGQGQLPQAAETYGELQKVGARGASLAVSGLANLALYEGRYRQAQQILESGVAVDVAAKELDRAADNFAMLAYTELLRGEKQAALADAKKALAGSQSAKIRFLAARTYLEAGEPTKCENWPPHSVLNSRRAASLCQDNPGGGRLEGARPQEGAPVFDGGQEPGRYLACSPRPRARLPRSTSLCGS